MLKLFNPQRDCDLLLAAAFGRLCVETLDLKAQEFSWLAAAFGRLCVETLLHRLLAINHLGNRLQAVLRCNKTQ